MNKISTKIRQLICISGIVQGVGFRPFVFQLAHRMGLTGFVCNNTDGVKIEVQGEQVAVRAFVVELQTQSPILARIDRIKQQNLAIIADCRTFVIKKSQNNGELNLDISPDKKICQACHDDILNPRSRFYRYPFTNCTHCGPRYTIIQQFPYDRIYTSMKAFTLCLACEQDYQNPMDRRYHAQPISCPDCGPQLYYFAHKSNPIAQKHEALNCTVKAIADGGVVAIKGLGGFHLVCDATQNKAVTKLRQLKQRKRKPFALMVANKKVASSLVTGSALEWQLLESNEAPIVLMRKKVLMQKKAKIKVANNLVYGNPYLGLMFPYTPLHVLLFESLQILGISALAMTSANLLGQPIATELTQIWQQFASKLIGVLDHDRSIVQACDDSLVQVVGNKIQVLRLARGYAPLSFGLSKPSSALLAVGAQQKSTVALANQHHWVLSPYIGELGDLDTESRFSQTLKWLLHLYQCQASHWIADKHPHYHSHHYAKLQTSINENTRFSVVQHHYAHILSVMAEHKLTQKVLGIALDGTGWGEDNTVWGGEVLLADVAQYQRVGHVRPFRLIGRHKAIQEPARILYALMLEIYSLDEIQAMQIPVFKAWNETKFLNLYQLWQQPVHSPLCSSAGRLFDAWAVLLGLLVELDYEGESGILIEAGALAMRSNKLNHTLELDWKKKQLKEGWELDWSSALQQTINLVQLSQHSENTINQLCHTFCLAWAKAMLFIAKQFLDYDLILSGGVCQNRVFMKYVQQLFSETTDCQLYINEKIPANDAGIAAGQLWHAIHLEQQVV